MEIWKTLKRPLIEKKIQQSTFEIRIPYTDSNCQSFWLDNDHCQHLQVAKIHSCQLSNRESTWNDKK